MVQRRAGHDRIHPAGHVIALELDLTVTGSLRRFRVDAGCLVTGRLQHGNEAAKRPAADLQHPGWRCRERGAHEWPGRGQPALISRHEATAYAATRRRPQPPISPIWATR